MAIAASELVSQAKAQVENLTPGQVVEQIAAGALVVDLREPGELANDGMIEDAVRVGWTLRAGRRDPRTARVHRRRPSRRRDQGLAPGELPRRQAERRVTALTRH